MKKPCPNCGSTMVGHKGYDNQCSYCLHTWPQEKESTLEELQAEIKEKQTTIESMAATIEEKEKQALLLQAEFENYKKRLNKTTEDKLKYKDEHIIKAVIIPLIDNLTEAYKNIAEDSVA